jgi:hypothetical protein
MSIKMNLVKLKIKAKHLAAEPAIIRHEERKVSGMERWDLQHHRTGAVRNEARATQLAVAFLKGKDINKIEPTLKWRQDPKHRLVLKRVIAMVKKYGDKSIPESVITDWMFTKESK